MISLLGTGLTGALVYVGSRGTTYEHPQRDRDGECRPSRESVFEGGVLLGDVWLGIDCNGKRGHSWTIYVSYEPCDEFSVRLVSRRGVEAVLLAEHRGVYCDSLKEVVEDVYDSAIRQHCGGQPTVGIKPAQS